MKTKFLKEKNNRFFYEAQKQAQGGQWSLSYKQTKKLVKNLYHNGIQPAAWTNSSKKTLQSLLVYCFEQNNQLMNENDIDLSDIQTFLDQMLTSINYLSQGQGPYFELLRWSEEVKGFDEFKPIINDLTGLLTAKREAKLAMINYAYGMLLNGIKGPQVGIPVEVDNEDD